MLQKVKQSVLGDGSHIRSKFKGGASLAPMKSGEDSSFIESGVVEVPAALSNVSKA